MKAVRDGTVFSVVGAMPSKSIGRCLMPFDRIVPMGNGGIPIICNASRWAPGTLLFTMILNAAHPCSLSPLLYMDFFDRSVTHRLSAVHGARQRKSPAIVVAFSQTRLSGTGPFHSRNPVIGIGLLFSYTVFIIFRDFLTNMSWFVFTGA